MKTPIGRRGFRRPERGSKAELKRGPATEMRWKDGRSLKASKAANEELVASLTGKASGC